MLKQREEGCDGPSAAVSDPQRLRPLMDAQDNIKKGYNTATPEKRRVLEAIFGAETFRDTNNGLDSLSSSAAKLRDAKDRAGQ